jgi:hypothetical protein
MEMKKIKIFEISKQVLKLKKLNTTLNRPFDFKRDNSDHNIIEKEKFFRKIYF